MPAARLRSAMASLSHRGPDAEGRIGWDRRGVCWRDEQLTDQELAVGLAHRRLSILDLSPAGRQPMPGPKGTWIVYNGEVYNYLELRAELLKTGHSFSTHSDTEVILAAYEAWGVDCVKRFNGMWAFALYDPGKKGLFCSRDRLGVKPFYYHSSPEAFLFASEIPALLQFAALPRKIGFEPLARYVLQHQTDDGEETLYESIRELRGGHCLWVDTTHGEMRSWRYWELPQEPDLDPNDAEALETFTGLLEDSVRLRLRSDVPLVVTLSGGTDSSAVAVAAKRLRAPIETVTSHFPSHPEIDETRYAAAAAGHCGLRSTLVVPDLSRLIEEEPDLTRHQALPFPSLSLYVHWAIMRQVREREIKVVLSGQGGDELFLGYEHYYVNHVRSLSPNLVRMLRAAWQASRNSRLSLPQVAAYVAYFGSPRLRRLVLGRRVRRAFHRRILERLPGVPDLGTPDRRRLQRTQLTDGPLSQLLRYDDRTTGAFGLETRLPFLDYRLVEFAYRLPWRHKIRDGWTKYLIRSYLDRAGLKEIAWRKHKLGFNAPQASWTDALLRERGPALRASPFATFLLRDAVDLESLPLPQRWDAYHLLHLASLLEWQAVY